MSFVFSWWSGPIPASRTSSRGLDADIEFTTEARKARKPYLLDVFRVFRVFVVIRTDTRVPNVVSRASTRTSSSPRKHGKHESHTFLMSSVHSVFRGGQDRYPRPERRLEASTRTSRSTTEAQKARKPYLLSVFRVFRVFVVIRVVIGTDTRVPNVVSRASTRTSRSTTEARRHESHTFLMSSVYFGFSWWSEVEAIAAAQP